jgi:hypothetical protein
MGRGDIYAGCSLDRSHHRIFRRFDCLRAVLRSHEVGGFRGYTVSHLASHQCAGRGVPVLRAVAAGEILK